jgi:hypothetical protein
MPDRGPLEWNVRLEAEDLEGAIPDDNAQSITDALFEILHEQSPAVSIGNGSLSVTMKIVADSPVRAVEEAVMLLDKAGSQAGVWDLTKYLVRMSAETPEAFKRRVLTPDRVELVGLAEVAEMLGISRQRASELTRRREFPMPVIVLAATPVWLASSVEYFRNNWDRKSGRKPREGWLGRRHNSEPG